MRKDLQEAGIIKEGILQENQLFNSPSYAAAFILGMHTNGRTDWKAFPSKKYLAPDCVKTIFFLNTDTLKAPIII